MSNHSLFNDMIIGGLASSAATLFSNPIEVCKTRLQLEGELKSRHAEKSSRMYRNLLHAFVSIGKMEGWRGLQGGLGAAIAFQFSMNGARLGAYEFVSRTLQTSENGKESVSATSKFFRNMSIAMGVGGVSAFLTNPLFMVKVRLQVANSAATKLGQKPLGVQYNYKGVMDALYQIGKEKGLRGLYYNAHVPAMRVGMGSAVQLSTYDGIKNGVMKSAFLPSEIKSGPPLHIVSSMIAAIGLAIAMNPLDVITTRLYNQDQQHKLYSSALDCFSKIIRAEGVRGLFKGLPAHYARVGPHTVITFTFWEYLKEIYDRHSHGLSTVPALSKESKIDKAVASQLPVEMKKGLLANVDSNEKSTSLTQCVASHVITKEDEEIEIHFDN